MPEILNTQEFVNIGYLRKGHGYKGQARLAIEDSWVEDVLVQGFIFFEIDGCKVPFAVESMEEHGDLIVKLEMIDTVEELQPFYKKSVFLLKKDITIATDTMDERRGKSQLLGVEIIDIHMGPVGQICRIDEYPQQEMAVINREGQEVLIPLHPDLIVELDLESKQLTMDLPQGLI